MAVAPRVRPVGSGDCEALTRKMAAAQIELVEYLACADERRDKGCLNDSMMLRASLHGLKVLIDEVLVR